MTRRKAIEAYLTIEEFRGYYMWDAELIKLVQECRAMNDGQRFGQLLYNVVAKEGESQEDFHGKLFYIEDHDLVKLLKEWFDK